MLGFILIAIVSLWGAALIIYKANKSNKALHWLSFFAFISGFGWFNVLFCEHLMPYIYSITKSNIINDELTMMLAAFSAFTHYMGPFAFLMFVMRYSNVLSRKNQDILALTFAASIVIMNMLFPVYDFLQYHRNSTTFWIVSSIWALVIAIVSYVLIFISYFNEIPGKSKIEKEILLVALVPISFYVLVTNYFLFIIKLDNIWRYNLWLIYMLIPYVVYRLYKIGRINIGKLAYCTSVSSMNTSIDMIYHEIKKEINNIHLSLTNYVESNNIESNKIPEFNDIYYSIDRLLSFMKSSRSLTGENFIMCKNENSLASLINDSINSVLVITHNKSIKINFDKFDHIIICDYNYVKLVFRNILLNAIEAIERKSDKGIIDISCKNYKKHIIVTIRDNGTGIPPQYIEEVFHPYVSYGKSSNINMGLGLTFCREVIEKHGWSIEIRNNPDAGVSVILYIKKT
jgi:signal transduction histidine kinase